jgi:hypothetical protein
MDQSRDSEAGIDALEQLAYAIAEEMVRELNRRTADEMLDTIREAEKTEPPKTRAAQSAT